MAPTVVGNVMKFLPDLLNRCCRGREGMCTGCHSNKAPCKNQAFCLPCEKHFSHQISLSKMGITGKCLKSLLLVPSLGSSAGATGALQAQFRKGNA